MSRPSNEDRPVEQTPIAIIGMACLFPNAPGLKEYWRLIRRGEDAITDVPPTHWSLADYYDPDLKSADGTYCGRGAFLPPTRFDPVEHGIPPAILEATDTAQLLGLVVAKQALLDAGYGPPREFDRTRVGVILGVTGTLKLVVPLGARLGHPIWRRALENVGVAPEVAERVVREISASYVGWQESSFPGLLGNVVAGRIANRLDLRGTNCVVDAACASSLGAVHLAMLELASGRTDLALTGGVDTFNDIFMFMCFSKSQALSPTGDARPFSKDADGTVLGEGVGMLVLKRLADAERDGDRIYAVIKGMGTSSDGRSQSIYAPRVEGQALALRDAYRISGVTPTTIELVEAHGTGTKVGDVVEFEALKTVYEEAGDGRKWCALGSVKSQIGHTKAAAGVASLVKSVLALHQRVLPATIKVDEPNPRLEVEASPFYLSTETRPWFAREEHPRRAAVSSFGFGGSNFHAVLEEYPATRSAPAWDGSVEIMALSAASRDDLRALLDEWERAAADGLEPDELARRATESRSAFRATDAYRLALVAERGDDVAKLFASAREQLAHRSDQRAWQLGNVFFGGPEEPGEIAFLFPGQGSQYVGMCREIVCVFPEAHDAIEAANVPVADGKRLAEFIYPLPVFDYQERETQDRELTRTEVAQPALGAVSVAMLRVLARFGIRPHFVAGHSYGELVALHAAGCIAEETLRRLSELRGQLTAEADGGCGAMLAVQAPLEELDRVLQEQGFDVVLANRNGPTQGVLSGSRAAVERVAAFLHEQGWPTKLLQVSAAFHSKLMAEAKERFRAALNAVPFESAKIPVFANSTGQPYPLSAAGMRDLLADQLTRPVLFMDEVKRLYDAGVRTFVEVGPKKVLTGLVHNILHDKWHHALAMDGSLGRAAGLADVARVVAIITVLGHSVDLAQWEPAPPDRAKPGMAIALLGANYRAPGARACATDILDVFDTSAVQDSGNLAMQDPVPEPSEGARTRPSDRPTCAAVPRSRGHRNDGNTPSAPSPATPHADAKTLSADVDPLRQAVDVMQAGLRSMQALQQQTAAAHQRFLETQERAHLTLQQLLASHQHLVERALGLPGGCVIAAPALPAERDSTRDLFPAATLEVVSAALPAAPLGTSFDVPPPIPIAAPMQPATPASHPAPAESDVHPGTPGLITSALLHTTAKATGRTPEDIASSPLQPTAAEVEMEAGAPPPALDRIAVEVVAELTGYPAEMLNLDMDLEADLGIDSIKRLEIVSAVQRRVPEMEMVDSQYLGSLRTLRNVLDYMRGAGRPVTDAPRTQRSAAANPSAPSAALSRAKEVQCAAAPSASKTVDTPGELERRVLTAGDLPAAEPGALQIAPGHEVWVTDDGTDLTPALAKMLGASGVCARVVALDADVNSLRQMPVGGLIVVAPATPCESLRILLTSEQFIKRSFALTKALAQDLRGAARRGGALLATVSRLDGCFGLSGGTFDPVHGGLAGLTKTVAHEWTHVRCRALDVARDWADADAISAAIFRELSGDGPVEVGLSPSRRCGLELVLRPASSGPSLLDAGDVVVVSGGARGVTAEAALALARSSRPTLVLLGRSPEPTPEPAWSAQLESEAALKRALLEHAAIGGTAALGCGQAEQLSPLELEREYRRLLMNREITRNLERLAQTGVRVLYRTVDVRDGAAVFDVLAELRRNVGPIRGLIHGAGVIDDRRIEDKTDDSFDRVFDTKVGGLASLLAATETDDLKCVVLFSSVTGRFGRPGQVDYAMANEVLNKAAQRLARLRPTCRVVSVNWGPWDGGMVTPALKREFARQGLALLSAAAGATALVAELGTTEPDAVEVVIAAASPRAVPRTAGWRVVPAQPINGEFAVAFERQLDVETHAFLRSHVIGGHPVLPVVMMLEWLGHGALHGNPGLLLRGFDDFRVLKGIVLQNGPRNLRVVTSKTRRRDDRCEVDVELRSTDAANELIHAGARAILGERLPVAPALETGNGAEVRPYPRDIAAAYREILFHGPDFRGIERILGHSERGMTARVRPAPRPGEWMTEPLRSDWISDPLVLDAGLQLGLLWCHEYLGAIGLPSCAARYCQYQPTFPRDGAIAVLAVRDTDAHRLVADLTFIDAANQVVARLAGGEWVIDPSLYAAIGRPAATAAQV